MAVEPIPAGARTLTPHLVVRNCAAAITFYQQAFDAVEVTRLPTPDGRFIMHGVIRIGDSTVMLCDEIPGMQRWLSPQSLHGTSIALHIWSPDVDATFNKAIAAGAKVSMPLFDAFWGDRYGKVTDPFGHEWTMATHVRDVSPAELEQAAKDFMKHIPTNQHVAK